MNNAATAPAAPITVVRDEFTNEIVATLPFRASYGTIVGGLRKIVRVSHRSTFVSEATARIV